MKKIYILLIAMSASNVANSQWTWQNPLPQGNTLWSVHFTDTNTGYAVGVYETILKTSDGGAGWTALSCRTNNWLSSVYFTDANTGYVAGTGGAILKTTNGGGYHAGIGDLSSKPGILKIYPNPTSTNATLETPDKGHLTLHNISGQQLLQQEITGPATTLDVVTLPSGVYFVRVINETKVEVGKIVKQ